MDVTGSGSGSLSAVVAGLTLGAGGLGGADRGGGGEGDTTTKRGLGQSNPFWERKKEDWGTHHLPVGEERSRQPSRGTSTTGRSVELVAAPGRSNQKPPPKQGKESDSCLLGKSKKQSYLSIRDVSQRLKRIQPRRLACLRLYLGQEGDDLVNHPHDGFLELAMSLSQHGHGRVEQRVVGGFVGEGGGCGEDRRG